MHTHKQEIANFVSRCMGMSDCEVFSEEAGFAFLEFKQESATLGSQGEKAIRHLLINICFAHRENQTKPNQTKHTYTMEDSKGLELVEKGDFAHDDGRKGDGCSDERNEELVHDDVNIGADDERDDEMVDYTMAAERRCEEERRCYSDHEVNDEDADEDGEPSPTAGMFHWDCTGCDDRWNCFWGCFGMAYMLPVIVFPIMYWSRAVITGDDDFESANQDAFEWILGCTMTTTVILFATVTIGCCLDNRREISNQLSAPAPVENCNFYRDICCSDSESCQGCCGFFGFMALLTWFGIALIDGSLLDDRSSDSLERQDEIWAEELVKDASHPLGIAILVAIFLLLLWVFHPAYSYIFNRFFQWHRRRQGYLPANVSNIARMLSSDEQAAVFLLLVASIPSTVIAIICAVRFSRGLEDGFSAVVGFFVWHFILFFAVLASIGPLSIVYGSWCIRNDLTCPNAANVLCTVFCPVEQWQCCETALVVVIGGVPSVGALAIGINILLGTETEDESDFQLLLFNKIFFILGIEILLLGVALFIGMVIYPIYAFVFCGVRDCCCSGRAAAPALQHVRDKDTLPSAVSATDETNAVELAA